jgi:hypothetical protein
MGGLIDTLWDLTYPDLSFDLQKELVGVKNPNFNQTLVSHNGFYAPTDEAFIQFIDGILTVKSGFPHWPDYKSLPKDIQNIIIGQQFMSTPIYPSTNQYKQVFRQNSRFRQNEEDIIRKEFGSNCTFIGINSYIPDKVFTSVTGPVFCRPHYTIFRLAMQYANIDDVVANHEGELYFFPIPDYALEHDSALVLNWIDKDRNIYNFRAYDRFMQQMVGISRNTLRNLILNHVGTPVSGGSTGREIIRTLRGNTITWDHTNNTIRGTRACTIGYHGETVVTCTTTPLDEPADNGKAWSVGYWFNF